MWSSFSTSRNSGVSLCMIALISGSFRSYVRAHRAGDLRHAEPPHRGAAVLAVRSLEAKRLVVLLDHPVLHGRHVVADQGRDAPTTGDGDERVEHRELERTLEHAAAHEPRLDV